MNRDLTKVTEADLKAEIQEFIEIAATSINPCIVATAIALKDLRVWKLLLDKLKHYPFRGTYCLGGISIPEYKRVVFDFDCKPGTLCLIKPSFLVVVDVINSHVVAIQDPYMAAEESDALAGSARADASAEWRNIHYEDGKLCGEVRVHVSIPRPFTSDWTWDSPWYSFCIAISNCITLFEAGVGPADVKLEVCYKDNPQRVCAELQVKLGPIHKSWERCHNV